MGKVTALRNQAKPHVQKQPVPLCPLSYPSKTPLTSEQLDSQCHPPPPAVSLPPAFQLKLLVSPSSGPLSLDPPSSTSCHSLSFQLSLQRGSAWAVPGPTLSQ